MDLAMVGDRHLPISTLVHLFDFLERTTGTKGPNSIYSVLHCSWKCGPASTDAKEISNTITNFLLKRFSKEARKIETERVELLTRTREI